MLNNSLFSSEKMDWETPNFLFNALNNEFHFDLDACATNINKKCNSYFQIEDNALIQNWFGNVWMNPPYGKEMPKWIEKAKNEVLCGNANCVVCLIPVRSDSKWWHNHVMKSSEIRLLDQRLEFVGSTNKAPFPVAIIVFDHNMGSPILSSLEVRKLR